MNFFKSDFDQKSAHKTEISETVYVAVIKTDSDGRDYLEFVQIKPNKIYEVIMDNGFLRLLSEREATT